MCKVLLWPRNWLRVVFLCYLIALLLSASSARAIDYEGDPSPDETEMEGDPFYWLTAEEYAEWLEMTWYGDPSWQWEEELNSSDYVDYEAAATPVETAMEEFSDPFYWLTAEEYAEWLEMMWYDEPSSEGDYVDYDAATPFETAMEEFSDPYYEPTP